MLSKLSTIVGLITGLIALGGVILSPGFRDVLKSVGPYVTAVVYGIGILGCLAWLGAVGWLAREALAPATARAAGQAGIDRLRVATIGGETSLDDQAFSGFLLTLSIFVAISVGAMGTHAPFLGYVFALTSLYAFLGIASATPPMLRLTKDRVKRSRRRRQRKFCDDCAELIPRAAKVCPHCGYRFDFSLDSDDDLVWL